MVEVVFCFTGLFSYGYPRVLAALFGVIEILNRRVEVFRVYVTNDSVFVEPFAGGSEGGGNR